MTLPEPQTRCGFVAFAGRPNVGKSTLLNQLLGTKLSITSRKPQTTRHRIFGIDTIEDTQLIYVDTPGLHSKEPRTINRFMNRAAATSVAEVDIIVFIVDASTWNEDDELALSVIKKSNKPCILFVNKVDKIKNKSLLLPRLQELSQKHDFVDIIPGSALKGTQIDALKDKLVSLLPAGEFIFPEDYYTDRSERFLAAEIVREKLIRQLGDELPYSLTVEIESFKQEEDRLVIHALILVEREGQKRIVIGKGGAKLKRVGSDARRDLIRLFAQRVHLELWVKVKDGWADDERALKSLGYDPDDHF